MDVVLKGRGIRVTDQIRRTAEHKLARLARHSPDAVRAEVEIVEEGSPRVEGGHRVEVALGTPHHTYRAEGAGRDVDAALDQAVDRLERQVATHRGKLHDRWTGRGNRLQSPGTSPEAPGSP